MINLEGKTVALTGPNSMIGRAVTSVLENRGARIFPIPHSKYDLTNPVQTEWAFSEAKADYCIHLSGHNGGIIYNSKYPSRIYNYTVLMAMNVLFECLRTGIEKAVSVLPSCAYSAFDHLGNTREILKEKDFLKGEPHPSVACHGLAKRTLFDYSRQIYKQFDFPYVCCVLNNSTGPYDSFDINKTKVFGGLIAKFVDAERTKKEKVTVFGTGAPRREMLYSFDGAEGIVRTLERYNDPTEVINIGAGERNEISIKDLAYTIKDIVDYKGEIEFDHSKKDGQMRKLLDNTKMKNLLEWEPEVSLTDGLTKTVCWYKENYHE